MSIKKRSLLQLKKNAVIKKQEKALESLCRRCGACCRIRIGLSDGSYIVHPSLSCLFLSENNFCTVYEKRHIAIESKLCCTREEMINRDYILPDGCPYVGLRQGYKTVKVVTQAEFEIILVQELERGNYNILLVDRVY